MIELHYMLLCALTTCAVLLYTIMLCALLSYQDVGWLVGWLAA